MGRTALAVTGLAVFLGGPLAEPAVRLALFGRALAVRPAHLPGHGLFATGLPGVVGIAATAAGGVSGVILRAGKPERDRLDTAMSALGLRADAVTVHSSDGAETAVTACVTRPGAARPWDSAAWTQRHTAVLAAGLDEALRSVADGSRPAALFRRWPQVLSRVSSRLRATKAAPTLVRRAAAAGDIQPARRSEPYADFFAVEDHDLRFRQFKGGLTGPVHRAAFVACDAVTVLPYDPARDRVLVVEQFRMGPFARGDAQPWSLEAVAGRVDPFETPEDAARREAAEEAGLTLGRLLSVAEYYPSPGAVTEFLYSWIGLVELPQTGAWLGGLESEAEDIRCHVMDFAGLMALIDSGEVQNAPLILSALWLSRARDGLRAAG